MIRITMIAAAIAAAVCGTAAAEGAALAELSKMTGAAAEMVIPETDAAGTWETRKAGTAAAGNRYDSAVYINDQGCEATMEETPNGHMFYVRKGNEQAVLGALKDLSGGDIASFCAPADISFDGRTLGLSCGEQQNGGYATRGRAELEFGEDLAAIRVHGEVKRTFGWKTETELVCEGLRPAGRKEVRTNGAGLRPCQAPGARAVVQCGGSDLTYTRPGGDGRPLVQAPYYTVNICADADGRRSMEVWPFQFFSSHSEGDMRTITRDVHPADMGTEIYFMGYSGEQYHGQPQFSLTLPREGDAVRTAVFYDGDSPFGSYRSKGGLYCVVNG